MSDRSYPSASVLEQGAPEQAVILVGGRGSRLGDLTADLPKPLLAVCGRPFLDYLIDNCIRFGFRDILLLAGFRAEKIFSYVERKRPELRPGVTLEVIAEPQSLRGTAGAVRYAEKRLADWFFLFNGDSILDVNFLDLVSAIDVSNSKLFMALYKCSDTSRYGIVRCSGEKVIGFVERGSGGPGLINGGVYLVDRSIVSEFPGDGSLERAVLPRLASTGVVGGRAFTGYFLDIGVPTALLEAQTAPVFGRNRSAVFFGREDILVFNDSWELRDGASAAVKRLNDLGTFVFLLVRRTGLIKDKASELDVYASSAALQRRLRSAGAHLDDVQYCGYDGGDGNHQKSYGRSSPLEVIQFLADRWAIALESSLFVGGVQADVDEASAAGMRSSLYSSSNLDEWLLSRHFFV